MPCVCTLAAADVDCSLAADVDCSLLRCRDVRDNVSVQRRESVEREFQRGEAEVPVGVAAACAETRLESEKERLRPCATGRRA